MVHNSAVCRLREGMQQRAKELSQEPICAPVLCTEVVVACRIYPQDVTGILQVEQEDHLFVKHFPADFGQTVLVGGPRRAS